MKGEFNASYLLRHKSARITVDIDSSFSSRAYSISHSDTKHYHAKTELFFIIDGTLSVSTESDTSTFSNCAVVIPPFVRHLTKREGDFRILISLDEVGKTKDEFVDFISSIVYSSTISSFELKCSLSAKILEEIETLIREGDEVSGDAAVSAVKLLLYELFLQNRKSSREMSGATKESYLIIIEKKIFNLSTGEVTLDSIAKELHLSKKQTSRIINRYFGKSLSELILERCFSRACDLLVKTSLPISTISEECGFNSKNYFYSKFKQSIGTTPLKYRKENKR